MIFIELSAAGHDLLIDAQRVTHVSEADDAEATDLCLLLGGSDAGRVDITCTDGHRWRVGTVGRRVEHPAGALQLAPWLPEQSAAIVDAFVDGRWRLR